MSDSPSTEVEGKIQEQQKLSEGQPDPSAPSEEDFIKLNAKELYPEILRLERENEDFKRVFNTRLGNKAAAQYKPLIQEKEREIEELKKELRRREISSMSEQDIEAKFQSDANFAREYTELVHSQPSTSSPIDETPIIVAAINDALDLARSYGVLETSITEIQNKAAQGGYDIEGEPWQMSLSRMNRDIVSKITSKDSKPAPPTANSSLTKSGPDLSPKSKGSSVATEVPNTVAEFKALPTSEQNRILATSEGMKAVEDLIKKESQR